MLEPRDPSAPLILVNPRASRLHDPAARAEIVGEVSRAVRARTRSVPWIEDGDLASTASVLAEMVDPPLVVAVGGDGTVRLAAAAVARRGIPLAVVPCGTGNVLGSSLGIRGMGRALDAIRHGDPQVMDLASARWGAQGSPTTAADGQGIVVVACGMGLDARIMAAAEHEWKRRMGFGAYVGAVLRELTRLSPSHFRIVADGEVIELPGFLALVANAGELVPGRLGPRHRIDPADGRLDLIVLGGTHVGHLPHGAAKLMLRTGERTDQVIRRSVTSVRIEADPAQPIEVDGDPQSAGWLEVDVLPGALTVLAPSA
jgi:diacylglycerol kinase family enzyme